MTEYRMDAAHRPMALDRGVQAVLGKAVDRIDGPVKVTGAARYAAEHALPDLAIGVAITATVASGRIVAIDTAQAETMPGVIAIITDDPRIPRESPLIRAPRMSRVDGRLDSYGEIVGVAVAESFEQARAAARAVIVTCEADGCGRFDMIAAEDTAGGPPEGSMLPDAARGDVDAAMRTADVTIDRIYTTPRMVHASMEPHAAIAEWDGDRLTLYAGIQIFGFARAMIARSLDIEPDRLRILSRYIGGGFGGKIGGAETVLAAIAAQAIGRPVKVQLSRRQLFHSVYGRSDTRQRIRLGATAAGHLTAIAQDSLVSQKPGGQFFEPVALGSMALYAADNRQFTTRIARTNLTPTGAVRAPGEAVGLIALEIAMDEMAEALGIDPIAFRLLNEPAADPQHGKPFSTRALTDCFAEGARRFGWDLRRAAPVKDGEWLIGMGVATAARVNFLADSRARVTLGADGRALIETDMTDLGTGTYTILAQIAGESLGLPVAAIDVHLGDSDLPASAGSGGSFGAASSGSSVALACEDIVAELARRMDSSPEDMTLKDGHAIAGNRRVPLAQLVGDGITGNGTIHPGSNSKAFSQGTHGAQFAEVAVSAVTGEVRVRRMLGVFDCGRVLNAKTARSQAIGGMIWGLGYALHEDAVVDKRTGAYVNRDLGEYHIPVNADVPRIDAWFIEEIDRDASPIGAKGLGELGITGASAAIANAIYHATGVRVREFPITADKLLARLPPI